MSILKYMLLSSALLASQLGQAQKAEEQRPEEAEILLQKQFIEASREKILGNSSEALARYKEIVEKAPKLTAPYYQMAEIYEELKQPEEALKALARCHELAPKEPIYLTAYAKALSKQGKHKEAAKLYEDLVKENKEERYFHDWIFYLLRDKDQKMALKVYDRLEKEKGPKADYYLKRHKIYAQMGKDKKALKELEELQKKLPPSAEHYLLLAQYQERLGLEKEAKASYKEVLALDPKQADANIAMAEVFRAEGDYPRYLKALEQVFADGGQPPLAKIKVLEPLVNAYLSGNSQIDGPSLQRLAKNILQQHPGYAQASLLYGDLLSQDRKYGLAAQAYEEALAQNKNQLPIWGQLMASYNRLQNSQALLKTAQECVSLFPAQALGYYYQGLAQNQLEDYTAAGKSLKRAIERAFDQQQLKAHAQAALGQALAGQKKYTEAEKQFEQARAILPKAPAPMASYCQSLLAQNKSLEEVEKMSKTLLKEDAYNPLYLGIAARLAYLKNDFRGAKKEFGKAFDNGGERNPLLQEQYGDLLFKMGDMEGALTAWKKAKELGSVSTILERKIESKSLYE
ncbi:tetratricopeptide repeat protein [Saprospira grandis]|uniref:TPR repeat-containing protein n=1 Tax=Saprospira grandis (strain Lewin) TaxID=984262 RepID=H6L5F0_SAPGL|nr:tetratricopeptide repeat protein [Saprospira grandis]AFC25166.1 TPR repeat-containing protein [Saprospira grandis str. Lewin]